MAFGLLLAMAAYVRLWGDSHRWHPLPASFLWLHRLGIVSGVAIAVVGAFRMITATHRLWRVEREEDAHFFARAGLPRTVYELLLGIAAADGDVGPEEHDAAGRLLTQLWPHRILPQDLKDWAAMVRHPRAPEQVARGMATLLTAAERERILECCREIAAADGRVDGDDRDVLERIAAILHRR